MENVANVEEGRGERGAVEEPKLCKCCKDARRAKMLKVEEV